MNAELTTVKKILVAAAQLDQEKDTFTAEDLIVCAWQKYPESFGLNGYRDSHPDSNRVLSKLMGSVGLCSRGWLEQVSTKTYRMTAAGRKLVLGLKSDPAAVSDAPSTSRVARAPAKLQRADLAGSRARHDDVAAKSRPREARLQSAAVVSAPVPAAAPAKPAPVPAAAPAKPAPAPAPAPAADKHEPAASGPVFEGVAVLTRLAGSVASQKFTRGGQVTFADACQFWAISPAINARQLAARLDEIQGLLERAEAHIQSTGRAIRVSDQVELTMTTVIGLQGLHRILAQKYRRELDAIRAREES
jgi:pyruvate/2-oxoglutarate dehydrogenase complex dihydrolipoamide acyltransferase (E2) component